MGLLNNTKAYLIGPIELSADPNGWRLQITKELENMGVKVYDPMIKPKYAPISATANKSIFLKDLNAYYMSGERSEEAFKQCYQSYLGMKWIREVDRRYVFSADFIVSYLPKVFSAGSIEELTIAAQMGKPILIWSEPEPLPSSWLVPQLCNKISDVEDTFFANKNAVLEYLKAVDKNEIELDPFKWCFLTYFDEKVKVKDVRDNYET